HTGQHSAGERPRVISDECGPTAPLKLARRTADPEEMQAGLEEPIRSAEPDWVLVYGDTNSTLAGARAAADFPVAHVEAGLRSGDLSMPEEHNRIEVDRLAALLLCPDERSAETLRAEGVRGCIEVVGDVMSDACLQLAPVARERSTALTDFRLEPGRYVLATIHREANVRPDRLARILDGLSRVDEPVLFPAHPRTAETIRSQGLNSGHVQISPPLSYLDFASLAAQAR